MNKLLLIKNSKKITGIILVVCLNYSFLFSQEQKLNLYGHSSNVISQASDILTDVNMYTGALNVNIPVYTINTNDLELPIFLSYYGGGVRPNIHPGWVGLNWNLNCGGHIKRVVKDLPDDYDNPNKLIANFMDYPDRIIKLTSMNLSTDYKGDDLGYYFNHDFVRTYQRENTADYFQDHKEISDTESDIYQFSFGNYSGTFFIDEYGNWQVKSDPAIKVTMNGFSELPDELSGQDFPEVWEYNGSYHLRTFKGFTIQTPDGAKYIFGAESTSSNTSAIEYSIPFSDQWRNEWTAMTWYLTKVITPNNHEISFEYEPSYYTCQMGVSFFYDATDNTECYYKEPSSDPRYSTTRTFSQETPQAIIYNSNPDYYELNIIRFAEAMNNVVQYTNDFIYPRYSSYDGTLIRPVQLLNISTPNETINFIRSVSNELKINPYIFYRLSPHDQEIEFQQFIKYFYDNIYNQVISIEMAMYNILNLIFYSEEIASMLHKLEQDMYNAYHECFENYQSNWPYLYHKAQSMELEDLLDVMKWEKLDKIEISDKNGDNKFNFNFSYNNDSNKRLYLEEFKKYGSSENDMLKFEFKYYEDNLPGYCSERVDHWGFYNNKSSFLTDFRKSDFYNKLAESILPGPELRTEYYNSRECTNDLNVAISGSLKEIVYPTGGKKHFIYEQNEYSGIINKDQKNNMASDILTGGIRVKEITKLLLTDSQQTKKYYYKKANALTELSGAKSSGSLYGLPDYYVRVGYEKTDDALLDYATSRYFFSSQSYSPLSCNYSGNHITYSQIIEESDNGSYEVMYYTDFEDFDEEAHFDEYRAEQVFNAYTLPTISKANERGKIKKIEFYNNQEDLVKEITNTYAPSSNMKALSLCFEGNISKCDESTFFYFSAYPYYHSLYSYDLTKREITEFSKSGSKINLKNSYWYNDLGLLSQSETTRSDGSLSKTIYKYPKDYLAEGIGLLGCSYDSESMAVALMNTRNMQKLPVEIINLKDDKVVSGEITTFKVINYNPNEFYNIISDGQIVIDKVYSFKPSSPLSYTSYIGGSIDVTFDPTLGLSGIKIFDFSPGNNYTIEYMYDEYDSHANNTQYHKKYDVNRSKLWGYNKTHPIAVADNANVSEIFFTSFEEEREDFVNRTFAISHNGKYSYRLNSIDGWLDFCTLEIPRSELYDKYNFSTWYHTDDLVDGTDVANFGYSILDENDNELKALSYFLNETNNKWDFVEKSIDMATIKADNPSVQTFKIKMIAFRRDDNTVYFDDFRFYPSNALMTTYTYKPLIGVSSVTDINNKTLHYKYDDFGRLKEIIDHNGYVVEKYDYHFKE